MSLTRRIVLIFELFIYLNESHTRSAGQLEFQQKQKTYKDDF